MRNSIRIFATLAVLTLFAGPACGQHRSDWSMCESYIQFAPAAAAVCASAFGVTDHRFVETFTAGVIGCGAMSAVVFGLKYSVGEQRPDGTNYRSFPSGHTATAFAGAEMVRKELGNGWGALAYTTAATVGALRVYHERHWWWDTVAGAGIGVLCADLGYLVAPKIDEWLGLGPKTELAITPAVDPVSGTLCTRLTCSF